MLHLSQRLVIFVIHVLTILAAVIKYYLHYYYLQDRLLQMQSMMRPDLIVEDNSAFAQQHFQPFKRFTEACQHFWFVDGESLETAYDHYRNALVTRVTMEMPVLKMEGNLENTNG